MSKYNLHELFRQFPTLTQKKPKRILIRAILESLTTKEIGDLITDCGQDFIHSTKDALALHIETILNPYAVVKQMNRIRNRKKSELVQYAHLRIGRRKSQILIDHDVFDRTDAKMYIKHKLSLSSMQRYRHQIEEEVKRLIIEEFQDKMEYYFDPRELITETLKKLLNKKTQDDFLHLGFFYISVTIITFQFTHYH